MDMYGTFIKPSASLSPSANCSKDPLRSIKSKRDVRNRAPGSLQKIYSSNTPNPWRRITSVSPEFLQLQTGPFWKAFNNITHIDDISASRARCFPMRPCSRLCCRRVPLILSSLLFGLFCSLIRSKQHGDATLNSLFHISHSPLNSHVCRFVYVVLSRGCLLDSHWSDFSNLSTLSEDCFPVVKVTSDVRSSAHTLSIPLHASTWPHLSNDERILLRSLDGCTTADACNATTPCTYGVEDPSDVFWLRAYNNTSKFVVLFHVGFASLVFFITAIIVDGSIFYPHRPGLALTSASALIMLALAALLYVLIVPHDLQFALYGKGSWNTIAYLFIVTLIAVLLPALAVIWISCLLFIIFFVGFLFEHVVLLTLATLHFMAVLVMYLVSNTALHVRLVYFPDARDGGDDDDDDDDDDAGDEDAEYDRQLLAMGDTFMARVRSNWFVERVPRTIEERALQIMHNHMPDRVHEQLLREHVPQIDFDDLEHSPQSDHEGPPPNRMRPNVTEGTPLLQSSAVWLSNATLSTSPLSSAAGDHVENKGRRRLYWISVIILGVITLAILLFFLLFIYVPNHEFLYKEKKSCIIESAKFACWQSSPLQATRIEKGRFTCWYFTVKYANTTAVVQYNGLDDFPDERDGCDDEASCGMEIWPCRVGKAASVVVLRWQFPVGHAITCMVAFAAALGLTSFFTWKLLTDGKQKAEGSSDNDNDIENVENEGGRKMNVFPDDSMSTPFSFRKRMPTWMQYRGGTNRDSSHPTTPSTLPQ